MLVFLDCRFIEWNGDTPSKTKLFVNAEELLIKAVKKSVRNNVNSTSTEDIDKNFNRINSVACDGSDLTKFMIDDPNCKLCAMNSTDSPIFNMGIDVLLTLVEPTSATTT